MTATILLTGVSGQKYKYHLHPMASKWLDKAGLYSFASVPASGTMAVPRILYIGQTDSLQRRMGEHRDQTWADAVRQGATHVAARINSNGEVARLAEERDLVACYRPPLNERAPALKPSAAPENALLKHFGSGFAQPALGGNKLVGR